MLTGLFSRHLMEPNTFADTSRQKRKVNLHSACFFFFLCFQHRDSILWHDPNVLGLAHFWLLGGTELWMTSARPRLSGNAEFRLRKECEWHNTVSKKYDTRIWEAWWLRRSLWASLPHLAGHGRSLFSMNENVRLNDSSWAAEILTDFTVCSHPAVWAVAGITIGLVQAGAGMVAGVTVTFVDVNVTLFA